MAVEIKFMNFNGLLVPNPKTTLLVDLLTFSAFKFDFKCPAGETATVDLEWFISPADFLTNETFVVAAGAGVIISKPVQARFCRFVITGSSVIVPYIWDMLGFHSAPIGGDGELINLGAGVELYDEFVNGIKSLESSDASVTIADMGTSVDLTVVAQDPLVNVGGGVEVLKPITSEMRTFVSGDGSVTISQAANVVNLTVPTPQILTEGPGTDLAGDIISVGTNAVLVNPATSLILDGVHFANNKVDLGGGADQLMYGRNNTPENGAAYGQRVMIGNNISRTGAVSVNVGHNILNTHVNANAANQCVLIGNSITNASGDRCTIVGCQSNASPTGSNYRNTSVGYACSTFGQCTAVGYAASANGQGSTAIGHFVSTGTTTNSIALGNQAVVSANSGISIGTTASVTGANTIGIGASVVAGGVASICIGNGARTVSNNEISFNANATAMTAIGRVHFGSVEAVHGSFVMPNAGVPQAYIKMVWNGVLYYIPAFTTVPV